ncbi:hypothetical protein FEP47_05018 [Burkholderia multivorans]|nr:hypothetical protein [Burkholderia multivorans]
MLVDEPRRAQIPPARGREHGVEAGRFERRERVARMARHAGDQRERRPHALQRGAPLRPPCGRQVLRRVDQKAGGAGLRIGRQMRAPPRRQRIARRVVGQVRVRDVLRVCGAARVDQRVVVRTLDVPVRMCGAQRVVARDALRHDFEQHAQPVPLRELREPREGVERAVARAEHVGGPVEIRDVARKAGGARRPERADEHMIEAHPRDMREGRRPCVERPDEAGVAEVEMRSEGRHRFHVSVRAGSEGDQGASRTQRACPLRAAPRDNAGAVPRRCGPVVFT